MSESATKMKLGATPGKLVLMVVLAIAFVGVLAMQFREKPKPEASHEPPPRRAVKRAPAAEASAPVADVNRPRRKWPQIARTQAVSYDPFSVAPQLRLPVIVAEAPAAEEAVPTVTPNAEEQSNQREHKRVRDELLADMRKSGMNLRFSSGAGELATIGSRVIKVGDVIEGFTVVAITGDGVVLEPTQQKDAQGGARK